MKMNDLFDNINSSANKDIYSVSRLNFEVAGLLSGNFSAIWITGELSNVSRPPSGHIYFTLKDTKSQVSCAMFKSKVANLSFEPINGLQVILKANVGLYEIRGSYQLSVLEMQESGAGLLQHEFEKLKQKLKAQGWFNSEYKLSLPTMPQKIGIVTSIDGAAIHDIISTFKRRMPSLELIIYPTLVQGPTAADSIAKMIVLANEQNLCDVLIVGRGGGSLEDLWAFNELTTATAIYNSEIPIVSAVGHESDVSIADFVADFRAATPTAAAEVLSPDKNSLEEKLNNFSFKLNTIIDKFINNKITKVENLAKSLPQPENLINQYLIRVDDLAGLLSNYQLISYKNTQRKLQNLSDRLHLLHPLSELNLSKEKLSMLQLRLKQQKPELSLLSQQVINLNNRLNLANQTELNKAKTKLASLIESLKILSPLNILSRGYSITKTLDNEIVTDVQAISIDDKLNITLKNGAVEVNVKSIIKNS